MDETLVKLCVNGVLKPEHQHLETNGLKHILHMPQDFQIKWTRFILICVHNEKIGATYSNHKENISQNNRPPDVRQR